MNREALYKDWTFARDALRQILRAWNCELSHPQRSAVMLVYDRTLGWGKEWEVITGDQIANGVWKADGTVCYAAHLSSNRTRGAAILSGLVDAGFLRRKRVGQTYSYALNLDHMKVPKRLQHETEASHPPETLPSQAPETEASHKEYPNLRVPKPQHEAASSMRPSAGTGEGGFRSEVKEAMAQAKRSEVKVAAASQARKAQTATKGKFARCAKSKTGFVPNRSAFPVAWEMRRKKYFPDAPKISVPFLTWNILHQYALNWTKDREEGEFLDYLDWLFENWHTLGASVFHWMDEFPPVPHPRILSIVKLRVAVEEAYLHRQNLARWKQMNDFERQVDHLTRNRGMDKDKAIAIAKLRTGYVDEKKKLEEMKADIEEMARRSKQMLDQEAASIARRRRELLKPQSRALKSTKGSFGKFEDGAKLGHPHQSRLNHLSDLQERSVRRKRSTES